MESEGSATCTYSENWGEVRECYDYFFADNPEEDWPPEMCRSDRSGSYRFGAAASTLSDAFPDVEAGEIGSADYYEESPRSYVEEELPKESIFAYSLPCQFPDILRAKDSAFGSIFVRTAVPAGLRLPRCEKRGWINTTELRPDSLDKDDDGPTFTTPVFRAFKKQGLTKQPTSAGLSQWDVYTITKNSLFSFRYNDGIHLTRDIDIVKSEIANADVLIAKRTHTWPSGSTWSGLWDQLGMAGFGTYVTPHNVYYRGKMKDGVWHDANATLIYNNGFRVLKCNFLEGVLIDYTCEFEDKLEHAKNNWKYCYNKDRRFWPEIQHGLKPGKLAMRTPQEIPRQIPQNCYDTNDGFYSPITKTLVSPSGNFLRVPGRAEEEWIKENCRKGFKNFVRFRPDLYENWFGNDKNLVSSIRKMQRLCDNGDITWEELQKYYAEIGILSQHNKAKRVSEDEFHKLEGLMQKNYRNISSYRLLKIYEGNQTSARLKLRHNFPLRKPAKFVKPRRTDEKNRVKIKFTVKSMGASATSMSESLNKQKRISFKPAKQPAHLAANESIQGSDESDTSISKKGTGQRLAKSLLNGIVNGIVLAERERHRERYIRTQPFVNVPFGPRDQKERCVKVLEELYRWIPDKDFTAAERTCDLKKLAKDRFKSVRYWGTRIFTLCFDEN